MFRKIGRLEKLEARLVWWLMIRLSRRWASRHMDQFESVKFADEWGTIYLSLSRETPYPNSFEPVDKNGVPLPR